MPTVSNAGLPQKGMFSPQKITQYPVIDARRSYVVHDHYPPQYSRSVFSRVAETDHNLRISTRPAIRILPELGL